MPRTCKACSAPIPWPSRGRPPVYCDEHRSNHRRLPGLPSCRECGVELPWPPGSRGRRPSYCPEHRAEARKRSRAYTDPERREAFLEAERLRNRARDAALAARTAREVNEDRARLRPDGVKTCGKCGEVLALEHYHRDLTQRDGLTRRCHDCFPGALLRIMQQRADFEDLTCCNYCAGPFEHVDHVIPRSQGGPDEPWNLVPACADCNLRKGTKPLHEFLDDLGINLDPFIALLER